MPLFNSIVWIIIHCLIALALNMLGIWLGLVNYGEVFALYFVIYSLRLYDAQMKFTIAYKEDPDFVESMLRHKLFEDDE